MVALAQTRSRMTVTEFLDWQPPDGRKWQLVNGELHAMAPANAIHAFLQSELGRVNPGVIPATLAAENMRVPDLAISSSPFGLSQPAPSNPILIVEILSPSNRAATWANVWAYTSIPSVQEILVLRADAIGGELVRRLPDGSWPDRTALLSTELQLDSIGFHMPLAELYKRTPLHAG